MANYTKSTNFATKDSLNSGNPLKIVKGTEIDTEFNNIQTAIATKSDSGGTLAVGNGGTGATTAAAARASLLPAFASNVGKVLAVNSSATDVEFIAAGGTGTVTSVGGTGTVNGISLSGTVTASGNLTLGGTLSVSSPTGVLPVANGGSGSASGVAASIVLAGTFSTGTYAFDSSSLLRVGASSPTANWRLYATSISTGTGHPAIVGDRLNYADSASLFCNDTTSGSASRNLIVFGLNNTGYASISTNGTTVTYGTSSDYRLKTNVMPLTDSTAKVKALKPCSYNWVNAPEIYSQGFLAHELAEVVPQAVAGEKDAVNGDGSIKSQQVDLSYVIPLLTSALQEAIAKIEALEVRITALESQ
jgi:hypothetical protein